MEFDKIQFMIDRKSAADYFCGNSTNDKKLNSIKEAVSFALKTQLTDKQQTALLNYYFEGKKLKEIAEETGVCISTVSRHIAWGKKKIKNVVNINCRYLS